MNQKSITIYDISAIVGLKKIVFLRGGNVKVLISAVLCELFADNCPYVGEVTEKCKAVTRANRASKNKRAKTVQERNASFVIDEDIYGMLAANSLKLGVKKQDLALQAIKAFLADDFQHKEDIIRSVVGEGLRLPSLEATGQKRRRNAIVINDELRGKLDRYSDSLNVTSSKIANVATSSIRKETHFKRQEMINQYRDVYDKNSRSSKHSIAISEDRYTDASALSMAHNVPKSDIMQAALYVFFSLNDEMKRAMISAYQAEQEQMTRVRIPASAVRRIELYALEKNMTLEDAFNKIADKLPVKV